MFSVYAVFAQVASLDLFAVVQLFAQAVMSGSVPATTVVVLVLIGVVALIRTFGPKLHALLPDHTLADKALGFLFDSKPGGWLLNALTTAAAGLLTAYAAAPAAPFTWALVGPILGGAFTLAGVYEFIRDLFAKPAVAPVP